MRAGQTGSKGTKTRFAHSVGLLLHPRQSVLHGLDLVKRLDVLAWLVAALAEAYEAWHHDDDAFAG